MSIFKRVFEDDIEVDEVYLLAKRMAIQEEVDNHRRRVKNTFWATTVSILDQRLNIVEVRGDDG